jgi:hypothetical protein
MALHVMGLTMLPDRSLTPGSGSRSAIRFTFLGPAWLGR